MEELVNIETKVKAFSVSSTNSSVNNTNTDKTVKKVNKTNTNDLEKEEMDAWIDEPNTMLPPGNMKKTPTGDNVDVETQLPTSTSSPSPPSNVSIKVQNETIKHPVE